MLLGWRTWQEFGADNCSQMAAALAYYILFAIVPLTMFVVSVLGTIAGTANVQQHLADAVSTRLDLSTVDVTLTLTDQGRDYLDVTYGPTAVSDVEAELNRLNSDDSAEGARSELAAATLDGETVTVAGFPLSPDDIDVHFDNIVLETIREVVHASAPLTLVSFIILGYAGTGLFGAVRRSLDFVWDAPRHRPMVKGKLWDAAFLLILLALAILTLVVLLALSIAASVALQVIGAELTGGPLSRLFWTFVSLFIPFLLTFVMFLVLYRFGPRAHNRFRDVWPGAVLSALGFQLLTFGYSIYVTNFSSFDAVYGALGGVLLFLFFTYLSSYVFLFGAELASEYPGVMRGDHDEQFFKMKKTARGLRDRLGSTVRGWFGARRD